MPCTPFFWRVGTVGITSDKVPQFIRYHLFSSGLSGNGTYGVRRAFPGVSKRSFTTRPSHDVKENAIFSQREVQFKCSQGERKPGNHVNRIQLANLFKKGKELQRRVIQGYAKGKGVTRDRKAHTHSDIVRRNWNPLSFAEDSFRSVLALGREIHRFYEREHKKSGDLGTITPSYSLSCTFKETGEKTLGSVWFSEGSSDSIPGHLPSSSRPSDSLVITTFEYHQAALLCILQQLLAYSAWKISSAVFQEYQAEVSRLLMLLPSHMISSLVAFCSDAAFEPLRKSLTHRGAKTYLELLCHHHLSPRDKDEWINFCYLLRFGKCAHGLSAASSTRPGIETVACLPLLPSSIWTLRQDVAMFSGEHKGEGREHSHAWAFSSRATLLLTASEAVALIRWCRRFTPEQHLSSLDIEAALRKWIQTQSFSHSTLSGASTSSFSSPSNLRDLINDHPSHVKADGTIRDLLHLWEIAKHEERTRPFLAKLCGISYTHHNSLQIERNTLVTFLDRTTSELVRDADALNTLSPWLKRVPLLDTWKNEVKNEWKAVHEQDARTPSSSSTSLLRYGSTKGYNEALIMGRWQWVLYDIIRRLGAHAMGKGKMQEEYVNFEKETETNEEVSVLGAVKEEPFFNLSLMELAEEVRTFLESSFPRSHALVPHKVLVHPWEIPRMPKALQKLAPVTREEQEMLLSPPTRGLVISGTSKSTMQVSDGEKQSERVPWCVQEIRHRLWMMKHLPPHLPLRLIRFDSASSSSSFSNSGNLSLPVLDRSPSRELLSWMLVSVHNLALSLALRDLEHVNSGGHITYQPSLGSPSLRWEQLLKQVRSSIQSLLFSPPHPCYIALNEFTIQLFTRLSYTCGACFYTSLVSSKESYRREEIISEVLEKSIHYFFQPPDPHFYNTCGVQGTSGLRTAPSHCFSEEAVLLWKEVKRLAQKEGLSSLSPYPAFFSDAPLNPFFSSAMDMNVLFPSLHWMKYLQKKISCLRNFHFSLYVEALAPLASGSSLLEAIKKETMMHGAPVFSPESAAAIVTALMIHFTSILNDPNRISGLGENIGKEKDEEVKCEIEFPEGVESILPILEDSSCRYLFLSFPSDKFHPVSSYFKGIFHPSFFRLLQGDGNIKECKNEERKAENSSPTTAIRGTSPSSRAINLPPEESHVPESGWFGSEALLNGRSLRLCEAYPTTTTERFLKFHQRLVHLMKKEEQPIEEGKLPYYLSAQKGKTITLPMVRLAYSPPPLRIQFCVVDIYEAVKFFSCKSKEDFAPGKSQGSAGCSWSRKNRKSRETEKLVKEDTASGAIETPHVIAAELPYGLYALYKPVGVTCTMHAHYPSLISYMQQHLLWGGDADGRTNESLLDGKSSPPILYQHGLINRIDVGTSGIVLVARMKESLLGAISASSIFRRVRKFYQALVCGPAPLSCGSLSSGLSPLWYLPPEGTIISHVFANGADGALTTASSFPSTLSGGVPSRLPVALLDQRQAITYFKVLNYYPDHHVYHVEVSLFSGRRHQIRQHFANLGFPLLGDDRYGGGSGEVEIAKKSFLASYKEEKGVNPFGLNRPALHASRVEIMCSSVEPENPTPSPRYHFCGHMNSSSPNTKEGQQGGEKVVVECPLPPDMQRVLVYLSRCTKNRKKKRK